MKNKPTLCAIFGSTVDGTFLAQSDVDVFALYEQNQDIPFFEFLMEREDPETGLIDGAIDFQYFAKDWDIFQKNPDFARKFMARFENAEFKGIDHHKG